MQTMNYLAHAYLSFENPGWLVGNLISDFVKGRQRYTYPAAVQQGIALHRAIDEFTDTHSATRAAKEVFRPAYRLYSGAFVDVVYDHFLATDSKHFPDAKALLDFTETSYHAVQQHYPVIPETLHGWLNRMREQNWLYNYQYLWGIERSFAGLVHRSKYLTESDTAFQLFQQHYDELKVYYLAFFPELWQYTRRLAEELPALPTAK